MAKFVLRDPFIEVNNNDISTHVAEVTVTTQFDDEDVTGSGALYKEKLRGLGDAMIECTVWNDVTSGSIDDILWPLSQTDTPFPVKVRAKSGGVSANNPTYSLPAALMYNYNPLDGKIGAGSSTKVKFENAGQSGLTRSISAT